jgi:putative aldouronate transport system permease protein
MVGERKWNFYRMLNYLFFIGLGIIMIYPFWHSLVGSLITFSEYSKSNILLFPHKPTFEAYAEIIRIGDIFGPLKVTMFITIVGTAASLFMTAYTAYGLAKDFIGSSTIMTFIVLTMFINGGLIPQYVLLKELHLINTIWVYIIPVLINTFYLIIMRTHFINFSRDLEESAKVDGCNEFGVFFKIVLPLSKPTMATIGLFYAVAYWNTFFSSIMFVTDASKKTLYVYIHKIISNTEGSQFATYVAFSETIKFANIIVAVLPIMLIYPFLQKYFVNGIMVGSIKG